MPLLLTDSPMCPYRARIGLISSQFWPITACSQGCCQSPGSIEHPPQRSHVRMLSPWPCAQVSYETTGRVASNCPNQLLDRLQAAHWGNNYLGTGCHGYSVQPQHVMQQPLCLLTHRKTYPLEDSPGRGGAGIPWCWHGTNYSPSADHRLIQVKSKVNTKVRGHDSHQRDFKPCQSVSHELCCCLILWRFHRHMGPIRKQRVGLARSGESGPGTAWYSTPPPEGPRHVCRHTDNSLWATVKPDVHRQCVCRTG